MAFCRKCGFELVSDANNCIECGSLISVVEKYVKSKERKKQKKSKKGLISINIAFFIGVLVGGFFVGYAFPQLISARQQINKKRTIQILKDFSMDQESYKAQNSYYGTIEMVSEKGKTNLIQARNGYKFSDLIINPNVDYWAVIASPVKWGVDGNRHYIITNKGIVRECESLNLPFKSQIICSSYCLGDIENLNVAQ